MKPPSLSHGELLAELRALCHWDCASRTKTGERPCIFCEARAEIERSAAVETAARALVAHWSPPAITGTGSDIGHVEARYVLALSQALP